MRGEYTILSRNDREKTSKSYGATESGPHLEDLFTNTYRNVLSDLDETAVSTGTWSDTIGEKDDEPVHPDTSEEEVAGQTFDNIEDNILILGPIASGGQAYINQAIDKKFSRTIAVKSLHDKLKVKPEYRRAFITEAKVTAQLEHPAIIPVYGLYEDDARGLHLSMKLVRGKTLKDYLSRLRNHYQKLPYREMVRSERSLIWKRLNIFLRVCEAISYVHHRQVIHRDLKPENIMIGSFNETYVMDWGIAEYREDGQHIASGQVAGTLQYMAPEVIRKEPYDTRSDIFLLGLILYEITFLKRAYTSSKTREEAIDKASHCRVEPFEHLFKNKVDEDLKRIIAKAMSPDPDLRYQSVQELTSDLNNYEMGDEVRANPDNFARKIQRHLRHHYKVMLFLCVLLLCAFATALSIGLYREVEHRRQINQRDRVMAEAYSKGIYTCSRFDRQFKNFENILVAIAGQTALLFRSNPQQPHAEFYTYKDSINPARYPKGVVHSPTFQLDISMDDLLFIHPESGKDPSEAIKKEMNVLYYLEDSLRSAVVNSLGKDIPLHASRQEQNDIMLNRILPPLTLVYVGLTSGLHVSYPFRTDYPRDFDPRVRGWYTDAIREPHRAIWSTPYLDSTESNSPVVISCSKAILDQDDKIIGVAGVDIMLSQLIKMLEKTGNTGDFILKKMLLDKTGRIMADSSGEWNPTVVGEELKFSTHPRMDMLKKMWSERNGWIFLSENGTNYLIFYLEIESLQWLYIERINFDKLMKSVND